MTRSDEPLIIIIGAGIIGLNVALQLAELGHGQDVLVLAEHMPGDTSINYTSPWAGADFSAVSGSEPNALRWDRMSYPRLLAMSDDPEQPYVHRTRSFDYYDQRPAGNKLDDMGKYLEGFRVLGEEELVPGTAFGISFTSVTINAPAHCRHLQRLLLEKHGVRFLRRRIESLHEVFTVQPSVNLVFNCIGGAAELLPGVTDRKSFPTRGQIVLAHAPQVNCCVARHGKDYGTYVIPRPNSGGMVVLGGYQQKGVRTGDTFAHETESILERTRELMPVLREDGVTAVVALAGLRPSREGGARVEREELDGGKVVVHNYGAGGTGYQAGIGMAIDAVALAEKELSQMQS